VSANNDIFSDLKRFKPPTDLDESSKEEGIFVDDPGEDYDAQKKALAYKESSEKSKQEIQRLKIENADLEMLGPHRRKYSWWIFGFVAFFVLLAFITLFFTGLNIINLSENVLITLLTTNMFQVVGLLYIVAKWLFTPKNMHSKKNPPS
jgi:hypothetical protein